MAEGKTTPPEDHLAYVESFSQWLDSQNDALAEPQSFSEWLERNNDSIAEENN